jgi:hypothetical protein
MKKSAKALATAIVAAFALPAVAGGPPAGTGQDNGKPDGIACQQAGISTLQALGLLEAVASDGIEVEGLGVFDFATVLELHRTMPELFQTGGVSVIVDGEAVPATWCD